jgi:hypothetical protein
VAERVDKDSLLKVNLSIEEVDEPLLPPATKAACSGSAGVIELLAALAADAPVELVPLTVKVYEVPVVNPETVMGDEADVPVIPPGLEVAVYVTDPLLPVYVGAVNATVAVVLLVAVAVPIVAVPGILPDCEDVLPMIGI